MQLCTGHLIGYGKKKEKLCGNFWQYVYYADESGDYVEKMPVYVDISKINN